MIKKFTKKVLGILLTSLFSASLLISPIAVQAATTTYTTDISYSGDSVMDSKFDSIIIKLRDYKAKNPKATEKQLNDYAKSVVKPQTTSNGILLAAASTDMDGYITGKLNSQELVLYKSNFFNALLCMANGKLALNYAASNYTTSVLHNGNGDAFRHCLWNFGMAIDVGQTFAKKWSDAHENGTPNNPALEKQMDLFNNAVGLQLAKNNPLTILHSTFISKSKEKCRNGNLKIISNNKLVASSKVGGK